MKKLIPILILGLLILSSFGAVASINNQPNPEPTKIIEAYVTRDWVRICIRLEVGSKPHSGGTFELTVDAPIMLFGQKSIIEVPWLPAHEPIVLFFGVPFGFGICRVRVTFDVDDDGEVDTEASRLGFIFGRWVFFPSFYVPIP